MSLLRKASRAFPWFFHTQTSDVFHTFFGLTVEKKPSSLGLSAINQTWQDSASSVNPAPQLRTGGGPVPLVHPTSQGRRLHPSRPKVKSEVNDGRKSPFGFGGEHRAVAQRRGERRLQVVRQIDLGFGLGDRQVRRLAQMAIANRPVPCGADVRVCASRIDLRHAMESLEALGQLDGRFRHFAHERTRSNTRPRNQKFSTPCATHS